MIQKHLLLLSSSSLSPPSSGTGKILVTDIFRRKEITINFTFFFGLVKGPAADATDAPQP
jgi:hypothetical protein